MYNKKTILITIVILIGSLVTFAFIQNEIQLNNETSNLSLMVPRINFHGKFKHASEINYNISIMPEYEISNDLIDLKNTDACCFPFSESGNYYHALSVYNNLFQKNQLQNINSIYPNNYRNKTKSHFNNHNSFSQSISFTEQPLELIKLNSKKEKNASLNILQKNSNHQHDAYYADDTELPYKIDRPFENNNKIQNLIVDPGDPPDGNPIPVQDGTCFLVFLVVVYGIWKFKFYLKDN